MTPLEIKMDEVLGWLKKAAHDIDAAEVDQKAAIDTSPTFLWDVLFHCQQSVEKSMKAFLTWHDIKFKKTHDIAEIGMQCALVDSTLTLIARKAEPLTQFAWEYRYPGECDDPTEKQAKDALLLARNVFQEILKRLPNKIYPSTHINLKSRAKKNVLKKTK